MGHTFGRRQVVDADGREWTVSRQWLPRPPRWVGVAFRNLRRKGDADRAVAAPRREDDEDDGRQDSRWWEGLDLLEPLGQADDLGGAILVVLLVLAVVALVVLAVVFVLPALILLLDLLLLLVLAGLAVAGRILFRRPWTVVASDDGRRVSWAVVGWGASRRAIDHVSTELQRGMPAEGIDVRLM